MKKTMSVLFATALSIILISTAAQAFSYGKLIPVEVVSIADGDTITVMYNGEKEKVRFLEVDTFEVYDSKSMDADIRQFGMSKKALKSLGMMGSHLTKMLVSRGDTVWLSFEGRRRGFYGRLLAFVHLKNGAILNEILVRDGMALVYRGRGSATSHHKSYLYAEAAARGSNLGVWGTPQVRENYIKR